MQSRTGNKNPSPSRTSYVQQLTDRIERLLTGGLSVPAFRGIYYDFFLEEVDEDQLSERELQFFGAVQEKLDWTDEAPDEEDKSDGWVTHPEFVSWLRELLEDYRAGRELDSDLY